MKETMETDGIIMDPDEFGVEDWDGTFVAPAPEDFPRYHLRALLEYTYSVGMSVPAELTEEERERFRIN